MKTNFPIKFKIFDIFIIGFALVCIVTSIICSNIFFNSKNHENSLVQIYYQGELLKEHEIDFSDVEDEIEIVLSSSEYESLLGDFTVVINKEKGICVKDVTCPNHYCEKQGWIKNVGYPLVCIPNGVYVIITSVDVNQGIILG